MGRKLPSDLSIQEAYFELKRNASSYQKRLASSPQHKQLGWKKRKLISDSSFISTEKRLMPREFWHSSPFVDHLYLWAPRQRCSSLGDRTAEGHSLLYKRQKPKATLNIIN